MAELRWGATTDSGRIRPGNEDNLLAEERVFVVADGMGGHRAGEVASAARRRPAAVAAERGRRHVGRRRRRDHRSQRRDLPGRHRQPRPAGHGHDSHRPRRDRRRPIDVPTDEAAPPHDETQVSAPRKVRREPATGAPATSRTGPEERAQRATTAPSINSCSPSSTSATPAPTCCGTGGCAGSPSTTATSRSSWPPATSPTTRRAPTRAATSSPAPSASIPRCAWTPGRCPSSSGDRFLLCSDGLVDEVRDDEIVEVLATQEDPQQAAERLVELANRQGGRDNITVVVVDVLEGARAARSGHRARPRAGLAGRRRGRHVGRRRPRRPAHRVRRPRRPRQRPVAGGGRGAATTATTTDESRRRPDPSASAASPGSLIALGVLAVLILAFVIAAAWARRALLRRLRRRERRRHLPRSARRVPVVRSRPRTAPSTLARSMLDEASIERVEQRADVRLTSRRRGASSPSSWRRRPRRPPRRRPRRPPPRRPRRPRRRRSLPRPRWPSPPRSLGPGVRRSCR